MAAPALPFAALEDGIALLGPASTFCLSQGASLFVRLRGTVGVGVDPISWIANPFN
jgi:hypothetical protein